MKNDIKSKIQRMFKKTTDDNWAKIKEENDRLFEIALNITEGK